MLEYNHNQTIHTYTTKIIISLVKNITFLLIISSNENWDLTSYVINNIFSLIIYLYNIYSHLISSFRNCLKNLENLFLDKFSELICIFLIENK